MAAVDLWPCLPDQMVFCVLCPCICRSVSKTERHFFMLRNEVTTIFRLDNSGANRDAEWGSWQAADAGA
jgi:hypothetical protein